MSQWISVKDQLPEPGKPVLGFFPCENPEYAGHMQTVWLVPVSDGTFSWGDSTSFCSVDFEGVTHWRELPPEPDEDA